MNDDLDAEQEKLLGTLVAAYRAAREPFVVNYNAVSATIRHPGLSGQDLTAFAQHDLVALESARVIEALTRNGRGAVTQFFPTARGLRRVERRGEASAFLVSEPTRREAALRLVEGARAPLRTVEDGESIPPELKEALAEIIERLDRIEGLLTTQFSGEEVTSERGNLHTLAGAAWGGIRSLATVGGVVSGMTDAPRVMGLLQVALEQAQDLLSDL